MLNHIFSWVLLPALFVPSLIFPMASATPATVYQSPVASSTWQIETTASSSNVVVTSGEGATSTTITLHAPYGVKSEIVSENGKTYATSTPLSKDDVAAMLKAEEEENARMQKMFDDEQKLFSDMFANF